MEVWRLTHPVPRHLDLRTFAFWGFNLSVAAPVRRRIAAAFQDTRTCSPPSETGSTRNTEP